MKRFTKFLSLLLALCLLAGCSSGNGNEKETEKEGENSGENIVEGDFQPIKKEDLKIGFIHISDPSDKGYTFNHNRGTEKMVEDLGLSEDQIINKFNTPTTAESKTALQELCEAGCNIVFATSFEYEDYVLEVAQEYPDVQFCHCSGFQAKDSGLPNVHNYFGRIEEARYLSGIAAGLKTETNTIGYVAAMPCAEVNSGFDAFYLGAKSVNPDVKMLVSYTNSWNDPTKEAQVAKSLIDQGADVLGQHCDSSATATTCESNGVYHVGYNSDMAEVAPKASIVSAVWDWSVYLEHVVNSVMEGKNFEVDYAGDLKSGMVGLSDLNTDIAAEGTQEKIDEARSKIESGELKVFQGELKDTEGNVVVKEGEAFEEESSAPSFENVLEGITVIE